MGDIIVYLWGLKLYCTRPALFHGIFFVYLCRNAVPKPCAVASLSSIRNLEIQENQDKRGHKGFLKFQKILIAFRWSEKYSPISTRYVEFFQDPVVPSNVLSVMQNPTKLCTSIKLEIWLVLHSLILLLLMKIPSLLIMLLCWFGFFFFSMQHVGIYI